MTDQDQAELLAWRLAFDHLGDGTPDGAAIAINERLDKLQRDAEAWQLVAESGVRKAQISSVYECKSNDVHHI